MKSKKVDQQNNKKGKKNKDIEEEVSGKILVDEKEDSEDHPENPGVPLSEEAEDAQLNPEVLAGAEEEHSELPDEVGFDDLTDDEREMLGLEAKPKAVSEDGEEEAGTSWEEFGYDEEELQ